MKKVTIPTEIQGIDWSQKQWVQYKKDPTLLVLTTGEHDGSDFSGTAMPCEKHQYGKYSAIWTKCFFQPLTFDIPFTISNSNE